MTIRLSLLTLFLLLILAIPPVAPVDAQSAGPTEIDYTYGGQARFTLTVGQGQPPDSAALILRTTTNPATFTQPAEVSPLTGGGFTLTTQINLTENPFPAFANLQFWWQIDGLDTSQEIFFYRDNRFTWSEITNQPNIRLYWPTTDTAFGQLAADLAQQAFTTLADQYDLTPAQRTPVDVYIYPSANDLQSALWLVGREWVGGHASPELGVILVALAPTTAPETTRLALGSLIPHELSHLLLYRVYGSDSARLPRWLDEGLAANAETRPTTLYAQLLDTALVTNNFIPFTDLCASFPADTGAALLAYAQSASFTTYLTQTYGNAALRTLLTASADGLACDAAAQRAFGHPLADLQADWRASLLIAQTPPPAASAPVDFFTPEQLPIFALGTLVVALLLFILTRVIVSPALPPAPRKRRS